MDPRSHVATCGSRWALALLFCLIFAGTILVAVLYLQLD